MMICDECGSSRVYWRCDNKEAKTTKYKCQGCGKIIIRPLQKELQSIISGEEQEKFKTCMEKHIKYGKQKGGFKKRKSNKPSHEKYLYKTRRGMRVIYKQINRKTHYYGTYKLKDAMKIRDELIKCDWDRNQLERIKKEVIG